jgi:hypothetical protein
LIYDRPEELLPLVDRLAGDLGLRRELGQRGAEGYQRHYSEERWMAQYFGVIEEIAEARRA